MNDAQAKKVFSLKINLGYLGRTRILYEYLYEHTYEHSYKYLLALKDKDKGYKSPAPMQG